MPTQDSSQSQVPSPFEIVTPGKSKKSSKGIIIALVVILFLGLGIFAGVLLVRQNQNVAERAATPAPGTCPEAQACPDQREKYLLRDCKKREADGTPRDSLCAKVGKIDTCNGKQFCCPSVGGDWTLNMAACGSPSASATATSTATATATSTSTSTSTATATATSTAKSTSTAKATVAPTKPPIPETGTGWPTYLGAGLGVLVIIGSVLLAF